MAFLKERAHLVDGAPDRLQIRRGRRLMLARSGKRGKPARAEIGARSLERMRARAPGRPSLEGAAHLVEVSLGAGEEQHRELALQLQIAVGEAQQVVHVDDRFARYVACSGGPGRID